MLQFDIDERSLRDLVDEVGATEKQAKFALSRALRRTAATLRKMSEKGFKSELDLKKIAYIRKRLKSIKFRKASLDGFGLWYGLNDLPVSMMRGSVRNQRPRGATWSGKVGTFTYKNGFVVSGANGRGRSIYYRETKARLPIEEARAPIKDRMDIYIEDEIFVKVEEIFWKHFTQDITARAKFGVGATNYRNAR